MRLLPLLQIEEVLIRKLTPVGSNEYEATQLPHFANVPEGYREREVAVNTQFAWKNMFSKLVGNRSSGESINWDDPDVSPNLSFPPLSSYSGADLAEVVSELT
jgi:hypothetical protein